MLQKRRTPAEMSPRQETDAKIPCTEIGLNRGPGGPTRGGGYGEERDQGRGRTGEEGYTPNPRSKNPHN